MEIKYLQFETSEGIETKLPPVNNLNEVKSISQVKEAREDSLQENLQILPKRSYELTLEGAKQYYVQIDLENWKFECLVDLLDIISTSSAIVYANTVDQVEYLADKMRNLHFKFSFIHSEFSKKDMKLIIKDFLSGQIRILLATDLYEEGLDSNYCSLIINYDFPIQKEQYIQRIGKSGKFGRKRLAINFILNEEINTLHDFEKYFNTYIQELPMEVGELL